MNNYLLPICYPNEYPVIISVMANSYENAKDKFMSKITSHVKWDVDLDWDDFLDYASDRDCYIGDIYDQDSF